MTNKYKVGQSLRSKSKTSVDEVLEVWGNTVLVQVNESDKINFERRIFTLDEMDATFTIEKEDWRPKDGDKYYYASSDGCVYDDTFYSTNITDGYRLATKNCFSTKAEAEQRLSEIKKEYGIK